MPIALLGLLGGFLTPAMVGSQELYTPALLVYLYFVLTGLMVVIRKKGWWPMAIPPTVGGALGWVWFWIFDKSFISDDTLYLGLFLIAMSITVVTLSYRCYYRESIHKTDLFKITSLLNYLTLGGRWGRWQ